MKMMRQLLSPMTLTVRHGLQPSKSMHNQLLQMIQFRITRLQTGAFIVCTYVAEGTWTGTSIYLMVLGQVLGGNGE